eukprot:superscaffoldBa00000144_g2091
MAALSLRSPTCCSIWISMFLLLIFIQMLTSLMVFNGVFIFSSEALIDPSYLNVTHQHGGLFCYRWYNYSCILSTIVTLGLYVPVVLVAFALLSMLLAAYAKDRAALWVCMACQAASSLLILTAIIAFLLLYQSHVSWEDMTLSFYTCVGVQVQLTITTVLTRVSGRRLTSDWE